MNIDRYIYIYIPVEGVGGAELRIGRGVSPETGGCGSCGNHAGEAIETDLR